MELDKNTLKNLYVDKGLSCQKIATMHNCSRSKIESLVKKYELAKYKKSTRKIEVDIEQFKDVYKIKGENLKIEGAFLGEQFKLTKRNQMIADVHVSKENNQFVLKANYENKRLESLIVSFLLALSLVYSEEENKLF